MHAAGLGDPGARVGVFRLTIVAAVTVVVAISADCCISKDLLYFLWFARRRRPWLYIWWKPWSQCPGLDGRVLLRAIVVLGECVLG